MGRRIRNDQDAMNYIRRALRYCGVSRYEVFDIKDLPKMLEAYDELETLESEDVDYITELIINNYDKMKLFATARLN